MYKVFYNDCRLIFSGVNEKENFNNSVEVVCINDTNQLSDFILPFLAKCNKSLNIYGDEIALWNHFQTFFQLVPAAGGLVKSNEGYLFIFRKGKWDLPKGKIDNRESADIAAIREVKEETGLQDVRIIKSLPSTWHIYFSDFDKPGSKPVLKETKWFLMEAPDGQVLTPESGEGIEAVRWFVASELNEVLNNTYPGIREMIEKLIGSQTKCQQTT